VLDRGFVHVRKHQDPPRARLLDYRGNQTITVVFKFQIHKKCKKSPVIRNCGIIGRNFGPAKAGTTPGMNPGSPSITAANAKYSHG
jgi:hypothetical protein